MPLSRYALFLSLSLAVQLSPDAQAAPTMEGPFLVNDLDAARTEARRTGKPLFIVFRCER
jgi:hypothetical protein